MAHRQILAFLICTFYLVAGLEPIYQLKGLEVKLTPSLSDHPDEILWKHNGDKVVDFNRREELVFGSYENRVTLDWVSAELTITHLTYEDSGDYELERYINNIVHRSNYKLEVIDEVAEPTISCEMIDSSNSNTSAAQTGIQAILVCSSNSTHPQSLLNFVWSSRGNVHPGAKLPISLGNEFDDEIYSCDVSNPLSNDIATFKAKDCYPDRSLPVESIVGIVVGICIALLLLLLLLGLFFCRRIRTALPACCEKGEKEADQSTPPSESEPFLDRAPTLPSNQRLRSLQNNMKPRDPQAEAVKGPPSPLFSNGSKPPSHPDVNIEPVYHNNNEKQDADSEDEVPPCDSLEPKEENEPNPAGPASPLSSTGSKPPSHPDVNIEPIHHGSNNREENVDSETEVTPCDSLEPKEANEPDPAGPASPLSSTGSKPPSHPDVNIEPIHHGSNNREEDSEEEVPLCNSLEPNEANEPDPPVELGGVSEDMYSDEQSSTAPEQTDSEMKSDEETSSALAGAVTPHPQLLCSPSTHSSPPGDIGVKLQENATSDQVTGVTTEHNHRESDSSDESGPASPLSSTGSKPPSHPDLNIEPVNHGSNHKEEDSDAEKEVPPCDSSEPEEENEPEPAELENEEAKSVCASAVTPQLGSTSTQSSPHKAPEDITVKPKEDTTSPQVKSEKHHRESDSSDDSSEEKPS